MAARNFPAPFNPPADPFREFPARSHRTRLQLLGGVFEFEADSSRLLRLVKTAYAGLPRHRMGGIMPRFQVALRLTSGPPLARGKAPPPMRMRSGAGFLCGAMDAANFAIVSPAERRGLVAISRQMLRFPYHARYELLEFAVFTLASRGQGLVSLHAACVAAGGKGVLLVGESGAGKTTLALQCLRQGMDFLTEDASFVTRESLVATGIGSFLHVRPEALRFLRDAPVRARVRGSPVISRRSGARKHEVDTRGMGYRLAPAPVRIVGVVFLSRRSARGGALLTRLGKADFSARLSSSQPYAANQPGWAAFSRRLSCLESFELRRARHPDQAAAALRALIR